MTFDMNALLFFVCWLCATTLYGFYMRRMGIQQGIHDTLITLGESKSELIRDALKTLEERANRHYRNKE